MKTIEEQAINLSKYLPGGRLFKQAFVNTSNLYKFLFGVASEMSISDGYIETFKQEFIPDQTVLFIEEWERALGIPDSCFPGAGPISERRTHVLVKLASLGVQTQQDFLDLAALFGITVTVEPALPSATFPFTFPILFLTPTEARFTILVTFTVTINATFPLTFPFTFGDPVIGILQCLFKKLKPANVDIKFVEV